jgi:hypothetical protein
MKEIYSFPESLTLDWNREERMKWIFNWFEFLKYAFHTFLQDSISFRSAKRSATRVRMLLWSLISTDCPQVPSHIMHQKWLFKISNICQKISGEMFKCGELHINFWGLSLTFFQSILTSWKTTKLKQSVKDTYYVKWYSNPQLSLSSTHSSDIRRSMLESNYYEIKRSHYRKLLTY